MQGATLPKRVDAARTFLAEERSRLRVRTEAMELASRAVAAGDDQRAAFAQFQELLDPSSFERSKVESAIRTVQRKVVPATTYYENAPCERTFYRLSLRALRSESRGG